MSICLNDFPGVSISVAAFLFAGQAFAQPGALQGKPKAKVELVSAIDAVTPGASFNLGIHFKLNDGWHIYWRNSGDSGLPPRVTWTLPDGFLTDDLLFPFPIRHLDAYKLTTNIIADDPLLIVSVTAPDAILENQVALGAKVDYLICGKDAVEPETRKRCLRERAEVQLELPVATANRAPQGINGELFKAARLRLPKAESRYISITPSVRVGRLAPEAVFDLILDVVVADGYFITPHEAPGPERSPSDVFLEPSSVLFFDRPVFPEPTTAANQDSGAAEWTPLDPYLADTTDWQHVVVPVRDMDLSNPKADLHVASRLIIGGRGYAGPLQIDLDNIVLRSDGPEPERGPGEIGEEIPESPIPLSGVFTYQACTAAGKCVPPEAVAFAARVGDEVGAEAAGPRQQIDPGPGIVATPADRPQTEGPFDRFGLLGQLIACLLYGLFINATPCVLPLLSIKVLGFVQQAHESRRRTLALGLAFGAGVMVFFVILGFLAAAGKNILQFPAAVIGLSTVVMALALSMLGVYTLQAPAAATHLEASIQREGVLASFGKGALAPVLGFACTGPLLAGAFGWATQQPGPIAVLAFLAAGLGMASPYMLLGANPNWLSFLPRPGNWMITFERVMGFLLLGMVVWLLSPLVAQIGATGLLWTLAFLVAIALACWLLGHVDFSMPAASRWRYRGGAGVVVVVAGLVIYAWIYPLGEAQARQREFRRVYQAGDWSSAIPWRLWSAEAVEKEVRGRSMVFVDFNAAWCTVCKANHKIAIDTPETRDKMRALDVIPFRGDFTSEEPAIAAALRKHGRAGPPLNLIYPAGRADRPIVLHPNLTLGYLLEKLDEAARLPAASVSSFDP